MWDYTCIPTCPPCLDLHSQLTPPANMRLQDIWRRQLWPSVVSPSPWGRPNTSKSIAGRLLSFLPTERDRIWKVRSAERCPPRAPWCAWLKHARLHVSPFGAANPPGITAAQTFSPVWRTTDRSRRPSPATLNGSPGLRKCPARELSLRWPSYQALRREPVTENSLTPAESCAF